MIRVPYPQVLEFRSPREYLPWRQPVQQVATVEFFDPLHDCIEFRGAMACKRQAPPLDFQHMLIPRLDPAAIDHITLDLGRLCDHRCEASPIADSKDEYSVGIHERQFFELPKPLPIRSEFCNEVRCGAVPF